MSGSEFGKLNGKGHVFRERNYGLDIDGPVPQGNYTAWWIATRPDQSVKYFHQWAWRPAVDWASGIELPPQNECTGCLMAKH